MGAVLSQAASGAGAFLGNLVASPLKSIFGASCDEICSGPWDVGCFVEHLCISDLFKFVLLLALCYIILVFVYLLLKVGIVQCVTKSLCKMCWTGFAAYCYALRDISCCLSRKLTRVRRRRRNRPHFNDIERGEGSSSSDDFSGGNRRKRTREDGKATTITRRTSLSRKLTRVRRRRRNRPHFNDIERGEGSSSSDDFSGGNRRKRTREDGKATTITRRTRRRRRIHDRGEVRTRVARLNVSSSSSSRRLRSSRRARVIKGKKNSKHRGGGILKRRRLG